eukprot:5785374-Prymnesium_polylepis.1
MLLLPSRRPAMAAWHCRAIRRSNACSSEGGTRAAPLWEHAAPIRRWRPCGMRRSSAIERKPRCLMSGR